MNTHGHHDCAETAGEPELKAAFERVGVPKLRLGAFYLGNWLTDVSQAVDPVAYMSARNKAKAPLRWLDEVIAEIRNHVAYQLFTSTPLLTDADVMKPFEEARASIAGSFNVFFGDGSGGRSSTLGHAFRSAMFSAGYFKFVHPESPGTMAYAEGYRRVFEERYTQYYPHEHLDRPEKKFRPSESPAASPSPSAPADYSQEVGGGLRSKTGGGLKPDPDVYEYLRDDIEVAAALLAEIDRDWASKVCTGETPLDDTSPEYNMYLAMLGHALHAVEDYFAHSNFVEHAAELLGHRPEFFQLRAQEVVERRLKQWTKPGDETRDDWQNLPPERHVVTGYFDFQDTLISLFHLLEELFDAKTMGLGDQLHELHEGIESAPAHAQQKYDEFKKVFTETLELLDDPEKEWDNDDNETAQALRKKYEAERKRLTIDPMPRQVANDVVSITPLFQSVPPEVVQNFVLACEHFSRANAVYGYSMSIYRAIKTLLAFIANPWAFIVDKLKEWGFDWAADLVKHYAKQYVYDWIGQLRIGCHSLIAKDHGTEWLYKHQKNCALAVHYYIVKTLMRHAKPCEIDACRSEHCASGDEQLNTADSRRWIDWLELLEYFLRNPRSVLTETKEVTVTVEYWRTHGVKAGSGDSLASLAKLYSPTTKGGTLTWQRLADVNFDTEGLSDSERKALINAVLRDSGTGHPVPSAGSLKYSPEFGASGMKVASPDQPVNYAFNPGFLVRIPDQVAKVTTRAVVPAQTCWFREVIEHETWEVFKGWHDYKSGSSRSAIEHHTPVYIKADELDEIIRKGSDLRRTLERYYVPDAARPSKPPAPAPAPVVTESDAEVSSTLDVQRALNKLGFRDYESKPLDEDGIDGPRTRSAVKSYQNSRRLVVDGIAGPITKGSLERDLAR